MTEQNSFTSWLAAHPAPDLQALVARWGGYWQIPDQAWRRHQDEMAAWQRERRDRWLR